jgi:uncharacterized protein YegL
MRWHAFCVILLCEIRIFRTTRIAALYVIPYVAPLVFLHRHGILIPDADMADTKELMQWLSASVHNASTETRSKTASVAAVVRR